MIRPNAVPTTPSSKRTATDEDYARAAKIIGCTPAHLRAVVDVEAAGSGYDAEGRPKILYEPHVMWRNATEAQRKKLSAEGLAYANWRPGKYPKTSNARYDQLTRAVAIAGDRAYKAASYGMPQILGENYKVAGYAGPRELFYAFSTGGAGEHLDAMARFIVGNKKMADALRAGDWAGFARRYNGPGYAKNQYDKKLEKAFARRSGGAVPVRPTVLSLGSKGQEVISIQKGLVRLGYDVLVDGDFGPMTDQAVRAFQKSIGVIANGIASDAVVAAMADRIRSLTPRPTPVSPAPKPTPTPAPKPGNKTGRDKAVAVGLAAGFGAIAYAVNEALGGVAAIWDKVTTSVSSLF